MMKKLSALLPEQLSVSQAKDLAQTVLVCYYPLVCLSDCVRSFNDEQPWQEKPRCLNLMLFIIGTRIYRLLNTYDLLDKEVLFHFARFILPTHVGSGLGSLRNNGLDYDEGGNSGSSSSSQPHQHLQRPWLLPEHLHDTDIRSGLSSREAAARLKELGPNRIKAANWRSFIHDACLNAEYILMLVRHSHISITTH